MINKKFGRLTVLKEFKIKSRCHWECLCECGTTKIIRADGITNGSVKSCGCLHKETASRQGKVANYKHGKRHTKTYKIWEAMKRRCLNPNDHYYRYYGERGVEICAEWFNFINFYKDMGNVPDRLTLDRIDNNGNYNPKNCRWATYKQQAENRSSNKFYNYKGIKDTLVNWTKYFKINKNTLWNRVTLYNWSMEKALFTPIKNRKGTWLPFTNLYV